MIILSRAVICDGSALLMKKIPQVEYFDLRLKWCNVFCLQSVVSYTLISKLSQILFNFYQFVRRNNELYILLYKHSMKHLYYYIFR